MSNHEEIIHDGPEEDVGAGGPEVVAQAVEMGDAQGAIAEAEVISYPVIGPEDKKRISYDVKPDIGETDGENPFFKIVPSTEINSYPKRSEALKILKKLNPEFSLKEGFDIIEPKVGEKYFFVDEEYAQILCEWLAEDDNAPTPEQLAVNNSLFIENGSKSKLIKEILDRRATVVSEEVWDQLMSWFGGGPQVYLTMCRGTRKNLVLDTTGKLVKVICSNDLEHYVRFFFHSNMKVSEAKKMICEYFEVDPDNARLHDFYKFKPFSRMDEALLMKSELKDRHLMYDNPLFLELADDQGDFHIVHTRGAAQVMPTVDVAENPNPNATKGAVGLSNLGNTCYMNSMLQCLSNVPLLKEEFLSGRFKADINLTNALGYKGKVAEAFHKLMEIMWGGKGTVVSPYGFRRSFTEAKNEFRNYEQHDSQEFLSELLDALHEDLNRVKNKPITETVQQNGRPDAIVAAEAFATHKLRHDSLITDLFTGLYKSTVSCPDEKCGNVSVTFDPFMVLPLPLQSGERPYHVVKVVYVPLNAREEVQILEVIAPRHGPCFILKELLKEKLGINAKNQANAEIVDNGGVPPLEIDELTKRAQFYTDEDPEICAKHDLLLVRGEDNRISDFYLNFQSLSKMSTSNVVMAIEVYDAKLFESSMMGVDEHWERKPECRIDWDYMRKQQSRDIYDASAMESDSDNEEREPVALAATKRRYEPAPATREERIGFKGLPFAGGDAWFGHYNFNESEQKIRFEVVTVEKYTWSDYVNVREEIVNTFGPLVSQMNLTEEEFGRTEVYFIGAVADTKERPVHQAYRRSMYETAFELKGLYIKSFEAQDVEAAPLKSSKELGIFDDKGSEQKSQGSGSQVKEPVSDKKKTDAKASGKKELPKGQSKRGFNFFGNKNGKKSKRQNSKVDSEKDNIRTIKSEPVAVAPPIKATKSTRTEKPAPTKAAEKAASVRLTPHQIADGLKPGELEQCLVAGRFQLFPIGRSKKFPIGNGYHFARDEEDESRQPIILEGAVDKSGSFLWGKYRVAMGFTKGEFFIEKFASKNWDIDLETKGALRSQVMLAKTKLSVPKPYDARMIVIMAHREEGRILTLDSIPDIFLLPEDAAELEVCEIIKAKLKIYIQTVLAKKGLGEKQTDKETGEEFDVVSKFLEGIKIRRANSRFETDLYHMERMNAEMVLDEKSDQPFRRSHRDERMAWLVVDWPEQVPFHDSRPGDLLEVKVSSDNKMTLSKALDLFSRQEKLNAMNEWYCGKCKTHQQAYKRLQIWSLPTVLVIQFKRFSQDEGRSTADKLEIPVDFPFDLDLKENTLSYQVIKEEMEGTVGDAVDATTEKLSDFEYSLVGVSSHVGGGLGFGHYIACVKNENDGQWYECNDKMVTPIKEDWNRIVNPEAYVLFYVRKEALKDRGLIATAVEVTKDN